MSQAYGAMKKLNAKHKRFVQEYLVDLNATAAATRAGYTSRSRLNQVAYRLMQEPLIKAAIAEANAARMKRIGASADDVLRELTRVGMVDIGAAFDPAGMPLQLDKMPEDVRRALAGVEVDLVFGGKMLDDGPAPASVRVVKVKFWDKVRALELLGKHHKLFVDKVEHAGADGGPLIVKVITLGDRPSE